MSVHVNYFYYRFVTPALVYFFFFFIFFLADTSSIAAYPSIFFIYIIFLISKFGEKKIHRTFSESFIFYCRYQGMIKGYSGVFRLGEATSTWDADSPVCTINYRHLTMDIF